MKELMISKKNKARETRPKIIFETESANSPAGKLSMPAVVAMGTSVFQKSCRLELRLPFMNESTAFKPARSILVENQFLGGSTSTEGSSPFSKSKKNGEQTKYR